MSDDDPNDHRRYIFRWHPLPQPPWGKSKEEARQLAIDALWFRGVPDEVAMELVDAHGEVVEVVE